jgi:hypothetical protein
MRHAVEFSAILAEGSQGRYSCTGGDHLQQQQPFTTSVHSWEAAS